MFRVWMNKAVSSIVLAQLDAKLKNENSVKSQKKVLNVLKESAIRAKKEQLVSTIIAEKRMAILILGCLNTWRSRLADRVEKYQLYATLKRDY